MSTFLALSGATMHRIGILLVVLAIVLSPSLLMAVSSGPGCMMPETCDDGCKNREIDKCTQATTKCLNSVPGCGECGCFYYAVPNKCGCYLP